MNFLRAMTGIVFVFISTSIALNLINLSSHTVSPVGGISVFSQNL